MRAMQISRYGGPEVLQAVDVPAPTPGAGQVLLRVHCASVNPVDWKRASGSFRLIMPVRFPAVPGFDVAGEVLGVGTGVTGFTPGMRVHARIPDAAAGACAELALCSAAALARMPDRMGFPTAAALPLAGMTALQALRDGARLPLQGAAQRVLVIGAAGGVGHLGVQIAKAAGAHVAGVCSTRNVEFVRGLGADAVFDYTRADAYAGAQPFDVVLDCVAGDPSPWLKLMTDNARYVSVMPGPITFAWPWFNVFSRRRVVAWMLRSNGDDLRTLDRLWEAGKLNVTIDSSFALDALADAWKRSMSGRTVGKIVIGVA